MKQLSLWAFCSRSVRHVPRTPGWRHTFWLGVHTFCRMEGVHLALQLVHPMCRYTLRTAPEVFVSVVVLCNSTCLLMTVTCRLLGACCCRVATRLCSYTTYNHTHPTCHSTHTSHTSHTFHTSHPNLTQISLFRTPPQNKQDLIISNSEDKSIRAWDMSKRTGVQTFR